MFIQGFHRENQLGTAQKSMPILFFKSITLGVYVFVSHSACADNAASFGIWANYHYLPGEPSNQNSWGQVGDEAFIIYSDRSATSESPVTYSAELRVGPGSFTDVDNNSSGDNFALHKAWVGWQLDDNHNLVIGKSQVPFAWKTTNFWPGDLLLAGFGDQMDVGLKLSGTKASLVYQAAFYLSDDWGSTSTDTVDDNRHWGSATSYRKVNTLVGDFAYQISDTHSVGVAYQNGRLQDLNDPQRRLDGHHDAAAIYYKGTWSALSLKGSAIAMSRDLPDAYAVSQAKEPRIKNQRLAAELIYQRGKWHWYIDLSTAYPDTQDSDAGHIYSIAPGARYDYGPGWIYFEYLAQNGYIDRDGQIQEGDFDALYISMDFYFQ